MKKRFEKIGGRIRLLLSPYLTIDDLDRELREAIQLIDFEHLLHAGKIDETGALPSLYYSIVSDDETGFMEKTIEFCSPLARELAVDEFQSRSREDAKNFFLLARQSTIAAEVAGRIFENYIHARLSNCKSITLCAKYLVNAGENLAFKIILEFDDVKRNKGKFNLARLVNIDQDRMTVTLTLPPSVKHVENMSGCSKMGWANVVPPNQRNPDYDALHLPFIIRQDTISRTHPFQNSRVSALIKEVKGFLKSSCSNRKKINDMLKACKLPEFPWFAYFLPSDVYEDFEYQKPLTTRKKTMIRSSNIPQIAVEMPFENSV